MLKVSTRKWQQDNGRSRFFQKEQRKQVTRFGWPVTCSKESGRNMVLPSTGIANHWVLPTGTARACMLTSPTHCSGPPAKKKSSTKCAKPSVLLLKNILPYMVQTMN